MTTNNKSTMDEQDFIRSVQKRVLEAVARGDIDLNLLAREELAKRDLDEKKDALAEKAPAVKYFSEAVHELFTLNGKMYWVEEQSIFGVMGRTYYSLRKYGRQRGSAEWNELPKSAKNLVAKLDALFCAKDPATRKPYVQPEWL